jgi:hypothetical protein
MYVVPHLHGVIVGTGVGQFIIDWFRYVNMHMIVRNMAHLDEFAPTQLRELWGSQPEALRANATSTVYEFGYCAEEARFRGFAYRSEKNFVSESLPYAMGIKPALEPGEISTLPADFVRVARLQRDADRAKVVEDQVGVGGDLFFLHITAEGMTLNQCYRFDDYEDAYEEMCRNI